MPQGREIFPLLTVEENLETGFAPLKRDQRTVPDDVFSLFPVLNSMLGRRGGDLSGGQQQQLAIGRALVMRPRLLLLDEPTEGIQPSIIKDIGRAISYLRGLKEMAIVLVEQYLDFAQELGDPLVVMDRGAIVYSATRRTLDEGALKRAHGDLMMLPSSRLIAGLTGVGGCLPRCLSRGMTAALATRNEIFAANRATGHIALDVAARRPHAAHRRARRRLAARALSQRHGRRAGRDDGQHRRRHDRRRPLRRRFCRSAPARG